MGLFERMQAQRLGSTLPVEPVRPAPFRLVRDPDARNGLMLRRTRADLAAEKTLWSRTFASRIEAAAVLAAAKADPAKLVFWGRLVLALGTVPLEPVIEAIAAKARDKAAEEAARRAKEAALRSQINLYVSERKGRFFLDLQRGGASDPAWSIRFDGRAERDRMCDWLRWQAARFGAYLAFAEVNGDRALERRLVDEMFATEQRLKKEGRVASGLRPLRMWRGE